MANTPGSPVLCIGGAVIDRNLETLAPPLLATSNPVRSRISHGGVARNVAETLARLGGHVALASLIGEDRQGADLRARAQAAGIDGELLRTVSGARTAEYTAVFHGGELFAAFADMEIFDSWPVSALDEMAARLAAAAWVFAECNLPPAVLAGLRRMRSGLSCRLAVDAVSVAKSARLGKDLTHVDLLFLNREEARALTGADEPHQAMLKLNERGAGATVLTDGAAGLHVFEAGRRLFMPASPATPVNASGAGDALIAGTLLRLVEQAPLVDALEFGMTCAAFAVACRDAVVSDLTRDKVQRSMSLEHDAGA
jgi:pseudouridine kinase